MGLLIVRIAENWTVQHTYLIVITIILLFGMMTCSVVIANSIRSYRTTLSLMLSFLHWLSSIKYPDQRSANEQARLHEAPNQLRLLSAKLLATYETLPFRRLLVACFVLPKRRRLVKAIHLLHSMADHIQASLEQKQLPFHLHRLRLNRIVHLLR